MFHTAELGKHIGWNEIRRIKKHCHKYKDENGVEIPNRWIYNDYSENGLIFIYYVPTPEQKLKYNYPWMKVIVNFSKLLRESEQVNLPKYDETAELIQLFHAYMETACAEQRAYAGDDEEDEEIYQCNTLELRVQRLDCTMQVTGLSQKEIDGYIHVYSQSYRRGFDRTRPRGLSQYDKWGNLLRGERKGSAYFASKEVGVNIYDKRQQMLNVNEVLATKGKKSKYDKDDIDRATGILRVEFQCYPNALRYRMKKFKPAGVRRLRTLENVLDSRISEDIIFSNLKRLAWREPHINLRAAQRQIAKSNSRVKERLLQILSAGTVKGRRMHEVKNYIDKPEYFTADLRKIRELGFNPILLPINGSISKLENLYNVLEKQTRVWSYDPEDLQDEYAPSGDFDVFEEYTEDELMDDDIEE